MQITVIGAGYVGLVVAAGFASVGHLVHCVESDPSKLEMLREKRCPIYEPGLQELLASEAARLTFSSDLRAALATSSVCFVCVGTPEGAEGAADLAATEAALTSIGQLLSGPQVIVLKSTVPVGTHRLATRILRANTRFDVDVVSNPEFLREGSALEDFLQPERIVLGVTSQRAETALRELYAPIVKQANAAVVVMDNASAEITKYAANAMLATRISFMNEIANLCELLGADVAQVRAGIQLDRRIGALFLDAGIGYGGCCFPKDVRALIHTSIALERPLKILSAVDGVNRAQRLRLVEKVATHFDHRLDAVRLALWGLSFKPNTDDVRDAPALTIAKALIERGAHVTAYDPQANRRFVTSEVPGITLASDAFTAAYAAQALIVATEWPEFADADLARLRASLAEPTIFDGRNLWRPDKMAKLGFTYHSVGRRVARPEHTSPRAASALQAGGEL
ncbi:MAG: UDP-glucose dehydrogenase family protein [Myxococcota bacterium]